MLKISKIGDTYFHNLTNFEKIHQTMWLFVYHKVVNGEGGDEVTRQNDTDFENTSEIIEKYKSTVYAVALTHTKTKYDADDVFQEVFLAYWKRRPKIRDEEHLKAWLIRTTINQCKKTYNTSIWRRAVSVAEIGEDASFCFSLPLENTLFCALQKMSPKLRSVIHLYYFEEMSVKEIAKLLRMREGTVRMQLTRGRDKLRELIGRK